MSSAQQRQAALLASQLAHLSRDWSQNRLFAASRLDTAIVGMEVAIEELQATAAVAPQLAKAIQFMTALDETGRPVEVE